VTILHRTGIQRHAHRYGSGMPNRLADATSPYLLQHADNPVDWYEWGDEAFTAAQERDVPILLSVGYSACHWCHVMAHESFEDPAAAAFMNEHFVNVKVDREERPDVDRIYMDAVQAMTGQGGWPMTVFLTAEGEPFFGGTYFPNRPMHGRPSFLEVLRRIDELWRVRRPELREQARRLTEAIRAATAPPADLPGRADVDGIIDAVAARFDDEFGGFGLAPKFPQPTVLELLLRYRVLGDDPDRRALALRLATGTLEPIRRGGIHDHLGGGFARYSVDRRWLVPHFEKMLYDNALLARTYLRAWQLTGVEVFLATTRSTLDYLASDMRDPSGGLHASEDADSEGVEGRYYVWTWDELRDTLGDRTELAAAIYGATPEGNFEGANVLHLPAPLPELARSLGMETSDLTRAKEEIDRLLVERRARRVHPGRDDKIVSSWNGLALRAFAEAAAILDDGGYLDVARGIAGYLRDGAHGPDGFVRATRNGRPGPPAFADDHAAAAVGLLTLFAVDGDLAWFDAADRHVRRLREAFADPAGGFFATAVDAAGLIARPKNLQDSPVPSDNALAAEALVMHGALTGDTGATELVDATVRGAGRLVWDHPLFTGHLLAVWLTALAGIDEVAVVGPASRRAPLEAVVWETFRPTAVCAVGDGPTPAVPLLAGRDPGPGAAAFVCRELRCELPTTTPEALRERLGREIPG